MQTFEISVGKDIHGDPHDLSTVVSRWFTAWSPGDAPWDGEAFRAVFKPGAGAVAIVDDMGGTVVTLDSVDTYIETWTPFMAPFSHWRIAPVGPVKAHVSGDLAVVTLTFEADGRDADGKDLLPKPGQHGTLVLERAGAGWQVIREHLTTITHPQGL